MSLLSPLRYAHRLVAEHVSNGDRVIDATVGKGRDTLFLCEAVGSTGLVYGFDIQSVALQQAEQHLAQHIGTAAVVAQYSEQHRDIDVAGYHNSTLQNSGTTASGQHSTQRHSEPTAGGQHCMQHHSEPTDGGQCSKEQTNKSSTIQNVDHVLNELPAEARVLLWQQSHANMCDFIPNDEHGQIAAIMFNLGYLPGGDHRLTTLPASTIRALEAALELLKVNGLLSIMVYPGHPEGREEAEKVNEWAHQLPQQSYQVRRYESMNQVNHPPYHIAIVKS